MMNNYILQLDIEMANVTKADIKRLVENLIIFSWPYLESAPYVPFSTMSYEDAIQNYGTDKPDTRFQWQVCFLQSLNYSAPFDSFRYYYLFVFCEVEVIIYQS